MEGSEERGEKRTVCLYAATSLPPRVANGNQGTIKYQIGANEG